MSDPRRPVSYSELAAFRMCPLKHHLGYTLGYKPREEKEAFRLGHIWHEIMETHYTVIKDFQATMPQHRSPAQGSDAEVELLERCAAEVGYVLDAVDDATRDLMNWAYAGYVEAHGCDPDWRILAIEIRGEVELTPGGRKIVYVIDLVVEDLDYGGVWIVDHKFPGDLADDFEIDLDDQLGLYWFCWTVDKVNNPGKLSGRVNGAMLNEARKKRNVGDIEPRAFFKNGKPKGTPQTLEQRFRRTRTSRTMPELRAIALDAAKAAEAMGVLAQAGLVYSSPNPGTCKWKCEFKEIHIISRSGEIPIEEVLSDFGFSSREERAAEWDAAHPVEVEA